MLSGGLQTSHIPSVVPRVIEAWFETGRHPQGCLPRTLCILLRERMHASAFAIPSSGTSSSSHGTVIRGEPSVLSLPLPASHPIQH